METGNLRPYSKRTSVAVGRTWDKHDEADLPNVSNAKNSILSGTNQRPKTPIIVDVIRGTSKM